MIVERKTEQEVEQLRQNILNKVLPDDGLAYAEQLFAVELDYSEHSLEQLNLILTKLHQQGIRPNDILQQQGGLNFLMGIAIYLCDVIAKETHQKVEWYNYYEAIKILPADYGLPEDFFSSMVAMINGQLCIPFGLIADILYAVDLDKRNFINYVRERELVINPPPNNPNDWCSIYLEALSEQRPIPAGNAYHQAMKHIRFDYSLRSVQEIDVLLRAIRDKEQLTLADYSRFIQDKERFNFLILIAFYLGMTISKHAKMPIKWFGFEEYKQKFSNEPDLEYRIEYHQVFMSEGMISYPIGRLSNILFDPEATSCLEYVQRTLSDYETQGYIYTVPSNVTMTLLPETTIPELWTQAFSDAGFLAAYASYMLDGESSVFTATLLHAHQNKRTLVKLIADQPAEEAKRHLRENAKQLPYQMYADDVYAYLPTGRTDAIQIVIEIYAPQALHLCLVVPYQRDPKTDDITVFSAVRYSETQLTPPQFEAIMAAFYSAAFQFKSGITGKYLWENIFQERLLSPPDKQLADPVQLTILEQDIVVNLPEVNQQITLEKSDDQAHYYNPFADFNIQQHIEQLPQHYRSYLQVVPPAWMEGDELYQQIQAMPTLYLQGRVVWAALIQANNLMFQPEGASCPGEIIFDPTGSTSPEDLRIYARQLYQLKGTTPSEPDQLAYAQHVTNEITRVVNYPFPQSLAKVPLKISSIWFWRFHLPDGMLSLSHFPILITAPEHRYAGEAMVLPSWFWPKALREQWLEQSRERFDTNYDMSSTIFKTLEETHSIIPNMPKEKLKPDLSLLFLDHISHASYPDQNSINHQNPSYSAKNRSKNSSQPYSLVVKISLIAVVIMVLIMMFG